MKNVFFIYYFAIFFLVFAPAITHAGSQTIDSGGNVGLHTSIALDSTGYPHISYFDRTNENLKYASWNGLTWEVETVQSTSHVVGEYSSLALDIQDRPHIAYCDRTGTMPGGPDGDIMVMPDLKYAYQTSTGAWLIETAIAYDNTGKHCSIVVNKDRRPIIAFYDYWDWKKSQGSSLRLVPAHMIFDKICWCWISGIHGSGRWFVYDIETALTTTEWDLEDYDIGRLCSAVLDDNDKLHLIFYKFDESNTNYLWYECGSSSPPFSSFVVGEPPEIEELIETGNSHDVYVSLAVDSEGNPHVSYYDSTTTDLKYTCRNPSTGQWDKTTVDNLGNVGKFNSIAIGLDNSLHISYYDSLLDKLKYAYRTASGKWEPFYIDVGSGLGKYTSLALDDNNIPHVSYYDETNGDLEYIKITDSDLIPSGTVSESPPVYMFPNPFRLSESHTGVTFYDIPVGGKLSVFTISGNLVTEIIDEDNDGVIKWDVKNRSNKRIARGLYYIVAIKDGNKKSGKLLIAK